jgi:hypothetical protein
LLRTLAFSTKIEMNMEDKWRLAFSTKIEINMEDERRQPSGNHDGITFKDKAFGGLLSPRSSTLPSQTSFLFSHCGRQAAGTCVYARQV